MNTKERQPDVPEERQVPALPSSGDVEPQDDLPLREALEQCLAAAMEHELKRKANLEDVERETLSGLARQQSLSATEVLGCLSLKEGEK